MALVAAVKGSLGAKVSLKLAVLVLVLTAGAAAILTRNQARQLERLTLEKGRMAALLGARYYGEALDEAIDNGLLNVNDVFDRTYTPIKGWDLGKDPKFHSRYDVVLDRAVVLFQDRFLDDPDFTFAIGVDDHGYIPTHNIMFQKPLTGVQDKDQVGNATKRIADYPVGLAAAQNVHEKTLVQIYVRGRTGEKMWDVSSPIFVKGKHWGAFRVGVSMQQIAAAQRSLIAVLIAACAAFFAVMVGAMYLVVHSAMKPVVRLTAAAEEIGLGEALETPIKPESSDEIGRLTKSIDRLRMSMRAAMSRLGH
jgi:HAMP domain-containing protein